MVRDELVDRFPALILQNQEGLRSRLVPSQIFGREFSGIRGAFHRAGLVAKARHDIRLCVDETLIATGRCVT